MDRVALADGTSADIQDEASLLGHPDEQVAGLNAASLITLPSRVPLPVVVAASRIASTMTVDDVEAAVSRLGPSVEHLIGVGAAGPVVSGKLV